MLRGGLHFVGERSQGKGGKSGSASIRDEMRGIAFRELSHPQIAEADPPWRPLGNGLELGGCPPGDVISGAGVDVSPEAPCARPALQRSCDPDCCARPLLPF